MTEAHFFVFPSPHPHLLSINKTRANKEERKRKVGVGGEEGVSTLFERKRRYKAKRRAERAPSLVFKIGADLVVEGNTQIARKNPIL